MLHLPNRAVPPFPSPSPKSKSGRRNHLVHDSKPGKTHCDPVFTPLWIFGCLYSVAFMQWRAIHVQELVTPLLVLVLSHCMAHHPNSVFPPAKILLTLHFWVDAQETPNCEAEYWVMRPLSGSRFIFVLIALILKNMKYLCEYIPTNIHIRTFMDIYACLH